MKQTQHPTEEPPVRGSWQAGETITFGGLSDKGTGYMGYTERVGPSVLVLHEAYGLGAATRAYVDRLAAEGFTVLAPDLHEGRFTTELEEARALSRGLDGVSVLKLVRAASVHLTENWHPRLGIVGFSMGGGIATRLVDEVARDATVAYYGYDRDFVTPDRWHGPLLGHFAEADELRPWEEADGVFRRLERAGHEVEWHLYEGTAHSFANPDAAHGVFDAVASEVAWEATIESLYYHLS